MFLADLFICLSVCFHNYWKSYGQILSATEFFQLFNQSINVFCLQPEIPSSICISFTTRSVCSYVFTVSDAFVCKHGAAGITTFKHEGFFQPYEGMALRCYAWQARSC